MAGKTFYFKNKNPGGLCVADGLDDVLGALVGFDGVGAVDSINGNTTKSGCLCAVGKRVESSVLNTSKSNNQVISAADGVHSIFLN